MSNIFGKHFSLTTFGESHGKYVGCVIDGCPSNLELSENDVQKFLDKRKPGESPFTSPRQEADKCEIVSGVFDSKTLGSPICILVKNTNYRSDHYQDINKVYRPGHADYTYAQKYKLKKPPPGGGRASARETLGRVAGGAVARLFVQSIYPSVEIKTIIQRVHHIKRETDETDLLTSSMQNVILNAKKSGDSVGGVIQGLITNLPAGFGEPVFDKLEADLAKAMLSIPAAKFFESGDGIDATYKLGSENNDLFSIDEHEAICTKTNFSGGIQGGISNGMPVVFNVGFKPVSTIFKSQNTVTKQGKPINFKPEKGRHDPCVLPRALIIIESMAWLVLAEKLKQMQLYR